MNLMINLALKKNGYSQEDKRYRIFNTNSKFLTLNSKL